MVNTNLLKSEIVKQGKTNREIADVMGISEHTLYNKICGLSQFKADEAWQLAKILGVEQNMTPYFFAEKVAKTATE